jgi:hypothetical protein
MENSNLKQVIKFQAMPMQELRILLENDLRNRGYATFLTNMSDSDLALKVAKDAQKPTMVSLTRQSHRPLELELLVDHNLLNTHDLISKREKSRQSSNSRGSWMMYRWLWIGLIAFWFIISVFLFFINVLVAIIEASTPGWTDTQRSLGILITSFLLFFWFIYIRPRIKSYDSKKRSESDLVLSQNIVAFIHSITYQAPSESIVRCWNCFEKINQGEGFCPHCGKQQN